MKLSKHQFDALVANAQRITLPYHLLVLSQHYQARCRDSTPQLNLTELAASIKALGLLQNLLVTPGRRGRYEVCGGGRRWRAMGCLIESGDWPENHPVPVLVVPPEQALLVSLSENRHQQPMHPADEFTAFATLIEQGRSVEDVAACFGVTPLVVIRRMKLAQVSPVLMALYRNDDIGLDHLMALASVEDHQRQEHAWQALPEWNRRPECLRALLAQDETASSDPLVCFVTVEAYEQAGGTLRRDLFSDEGTVYLLDRPLLEQLVHAKLALTADSLRADGWQWAETQLRFDYTLYSKHGRAQPQRREPTPEEAQRRVERDEHARHLSAQLEAMDEEDDAETCQQLAVGLEALQVEHAADEQALQQWSMEVKASAGCVVFVRHDARVEIRYGLLRPGRAVVSEAQSVDDKQASAHALDTGPVETNRPTRAVHSKELMRGLTAQRVAGVQAQLLQRAEVALAVLTAQLTQQVFARHDYRFTRTDQPLAIELTDSYCAITTELEHSEHRPALDTVEAAYAHWLTLLPKELSLESLVLWLMPQPQSQILQLLAFVVSRSVTGISSMDAQPSWADMLANVVDLDMNRWWRATAQSYFQHVSKRRIVEVVTEAVDAQSACTLEGMKKELCAVRAEQLVEGRGWLPECLRRRQTVTAASAEVD